MNSTMKKANASTKWELTPLLEEGGQKYFSADDVINAYLQGKKDQLRDSRRILAEAFEMNLKKALEESEKVYAFLKKEKIKCSGVYLKSKNIDRFNAVFIVDENQWCSKEFDIVYKKSIEIKDRINSDTFDYAIIFMPKSDHLDMESLHSDGYIWSYEPALQ